MRVRLSQLVLEPVIAWAATSPTSPGAGYVAVSQLVLEPVILGVGTARVSQMVLEPVMLHGDTNDDPEPGGGGGEAVTHSFGYAV